MASDRLYRLAKRRGRTPGMYASMMALLCYYFYYYCILSHTTTFFWSIVTDENIVMTGLPIRHDFAVQADLLGDRTTPEGQSYQRKVKETLGLDSEKPMILVMGGGEGVGSLSAIVDELYRQLTVDGIDATVCVVCGRNAKLQKQLAEKDWSTLLSAEAPKPRKRRWFRRKNRSSAFGIPSDGPPGEVTVVGLGFVTRMAEYMVAADTLVTKAGPGTIAEAAAVGLPVMLTSFLPGQEAGNVNFVIDKAFGEFHKHPVDIAREVTGWFQNPTILQEMSHKAKEAGNPRAASEIVLDIGSTTHTWMALNQESSA